MSNIKNLVNNALFSSTAETDCPFLSAPFSEPEISSGIKGLKKGKRDASNNDIIKATSDIITPFLVALFNNIHCNEFFPTVWRLAGIIIPLFKTGVCDDPNNYRGITINSCLSKLFTLLMNDRLNKFCEAKSIIHFNQKTTTENFILDILSIDWESSINNNDSNKSFNNFL